MFSYSASEAYLDKDQQHDVTIQSAIIEKCYCIYPIALHIQSFHSCRVHRLLTAVQLAMSRICVSHAPHIEKLSCA